MFDDAVEGDDESTSSLVGPPKRHRAQTIGGQSGNVGSLASRTRVYSMDNGGLRSPISGIDRQPSVVKRATNLSEGGPRRSDSLASPAELEPRSRKIPSRKDSRSYRENEEAKERRERKERREGKRKASTTIVKDDLGFEGLLDHGNAGSLPGSWDICQVD